MQLTPLITWLGLLLEYETTLRRQKQFETLARVARLRHLASVEDVDYHTPRGLDRALFLKLAACDWIAERRNLIIIGASGLGNSWLACALGYKACRENLSVLYTRVPRLFADLAVARGDVRYARLLRSLARVKLLILDDWGPGGPYLILIGVPTPADAILDRVVHNAYRIELPATASASAVLNPEAKACATAGSPDRRRERGGGCPPHPTASHRPEMPKNSARLTYPPRRNMIVSIRGSERWVAGFKSECMAPASSESAAWKPVLVPTVSAYTVMKSMKLTPSAHAPTVEDQSPTCC